MKSLTAIIFISIAIKIYHKENMADSKINHKNEKELTVAAAAVATSSCSGTKSPTTEPSTKTLTTEQSNPQKLKCDHAEEEKNIIEQKLLSGQYPDLASMATNINGGVPSKVIEEVIFQNMMKIMLVELSR